MREQSMGGGGGGGGGGYNDYTLEISVLRFWLF